MTRLRSFFLGPFETTLDGKPVSNFESDTVRALLAYLAIESEYPHRRESLASLFWSEHSQENALKNLRHALYRLRQVLGEGEQKGAEGSEPPAPILLVTTQTVQFNRTAEAWLDVAEFRDLLAKCDEHRHRRIDACPSCYARLSAAAQLYRGDLLSGFTAPKSTIFEEWLVLEREKLHMEAMRVLALVSQLSEARADYTTSLLYAQRQIALEPWREEAHFQAMRVLMLMGQRSAAISQYAACRRLLQDEFGITPSPETEALYSQIRGEGGASPEGNLVVARRPPQYLPAELTPFVGRRSEIAEVSGLLENPDYRLVTLVGPGGAGKTRLSIQVARGQSGCFRDGLFFVSLQQLTNRQQIVTAVAEAVGFGLKPKEDPQTQLFNFLAGKEVLLVLDNFEHLIDGAGLLSVLLREAPGVSILVSSREPLGLLVETTFNVEGLSYPHVDPGYSDALQTQALVERISNFDAIQLFLERAQRVKRDFAISAETAEGVAQLSEQVAGIPLGLELAAAWVHQFTPAQIAASIAQNYDFLTTRFRDVPEQHSSLRAVFNYSWSLLTTEEQLMFARLSVFRGGWDTQAAEAVAKVPVEALNSLLAKSLLTVAEVQDGSATNERGHEPIADNEGSAGSLGAHFNMHEMLRQYTAEEESKRPQEKREVQLEHAKYYAALAEELEHLLEKASSAIIRARLRREVGNFNAALERMISSGEQELAFRLVASLTEFWRREGTLSEGRRWIDAALALGDTGGSADIDLRRLQAQVLTKAAVMARGQGDLDRAALLLERSLSICRELDEPLVLAEALNTLGGIQAGRKNYEQARTLFGESLQYLQGEETLTQQYWVRANIALCWVNELQPDKATPILLESLAGFERQEEHYGAAYTLGVLGEAMRVSGDYEQAIAYRRRSLARFRELDNKPYVGLALSSLSISLQRGGYKAEAVPVLREALPIVWAVGMRQVIYECIESAVRLAVSYAELHRAANLFGALQANSKEYDSKFYAELMRDMEDVVAKLKQSMPSQEWDTAREEGASWTLAHTWAEVGALVQQIDESLSVAAK